MPQSPPTESLTLRDMRNRFFPNVPLHRLVYAVSVYGIEPVQRAANIRMFSPDQVPAIKQALARVASRRGGL